MQKLTFKEWLTALADHLVSRQGWEPAQAKAYVSDQPECWEDFYNDDYTPEAAAFEDATS
jgi:hypothetical protein